MDDSYFKQEYLNYPIEQSAYCHRCNISIPRKELEVELLAERYHPANKGKYKNEYELQRYGLQTKFEKCPFCGKSLIVEGKPLFSRPTEKG